MARVRNILALRLYRARLVRRKVCRRRLQEQSLLMRLEELVLLLSIVILIFVGLRVVSDMSAKFWAPHSIKQSVQQPATPASMTRALRGTRKDVSNMTPVELATRMNNEAHLRARIRNAQGEP